MKVITAHFSQSENGIYAGDIRDEYGQVESAITCSTVAEIKEWAGEHDVTDLILDKEAQ